MGGVCPTAEPVLGGYRYTGQSQTVRRDHVVRHALGWATVHGCPGRLEPAGFWSGLCRLGAFAVSLDLPQDHQYRGRKRSQAGPDARPVAAGLSRARGCPAAGDLGLLARPALSPHDHRAAALPHHSIVLVCWGVALLLV